ncbi:MAG: type I restriction endonuclease [Phocaeicola sp.]
MATDTSEKELEATIEAYLIDEKGERAESSRWLKGESKDFNPEFCVDETMLKAFLQHTQMDKVTRARIYDSPANTRKFLERLRNQGLPRRGWWMMLRRRRWSTDATTFDLYYPIPTAGNVQAAIAYGQNRWTVVRQLRYLQTRPDIVLMLNGLPIITLER